MAGLRGTTEQVAAIWRKIGLNQKLSIVLVGLGSAAALTALCFWSSRPDYGLLYGNLSRKDAAAIITQLQADGVDYKTEDNETAVLVPAEQVHAVRASLLTQGLPAGGPGGEGGFELLDESPIGMTDFRERKTYLRAAQGELARTISHVEAIEWARVHVSVPEPSVFLDQDRPATASVFLRVRHGMQLTPGQCHAIASLVSRSVEGLEPQNVTITDQYLNPLTKPVQADAPGSANAQLEAEREIETRLTRKVVAMLDRYLGPGRHAVSIRAEVKLNQKTQRTLERDPDARLPKRETTTSTKETGPSKTGGPVTLDPRAKRADGGSAGSTSNVTTKEDTEYDTTPKSETETVDNGVDIKRLTVSVLVTGTHKTESGEDGKESAKYTPLSDDQVTKLTQAVRDAVGADEKTRGDTVTVQCVEFTQPPAALGGEAATGMQHWGLVVRILKHVSTVFIVVAFLLFVRSRLRKARAAREAAEAEAQARAEAAAQATAEPPPSAAALRDQVASAVQADPDAVSDLLKSWYKSDTTVASQT